MGCRVHREQLAEKRRGGAAGKRVRVANGGHAALAIDALKPSAIGNIASGYECDPRSGTTTSPSGIMSTPEIPISRGGKVATGIGFSIGKGKGSDATRCVFETCRHPIPLLQLQILHATLDAFGPSRKFPLCNFRIFTPFYPRR